MKDIRRIRFTNGLFSAGFREEKDKDKALFRDLGTPETGPAALPAV